MLHAINKARVIGSMLIPRWLDQHSGSRRYWQMSVILKQNGKRAVAGLALLAAASLALLAGVPDENTGGRRLTVPEEWRGTWEVTVTYRDHETGAVVATDVTTAAICPGEPIAPPFLNTLLNLSGEANDRRMNISGQAKYAPRPGCNIFVNVYFQSQRHGDIWRGTGSWRAKVVGNCGRSEFGENIEVSGRRVSSAAVCNGQPLSLVHRFFAHSGLIFVLERRN